MSRVLCSRDCPFVCGQEVDLTAVHCEAYTKATEALQAYFKLMIFDAASWMPCHRSSMGEDTFVRMATNTGKSLCMFLAPLAVSPDALGVVISPLNGLMDQQVQI